MHWQVVVQAIRNFFYYTNIFRGLFVFWKFIYFFFENVKYQFKKEENDSEEHKPENDSHIVDEREILVPDNWEWISLKFISIHVRFHAQKIVSEDLE